MINPGMNPGFCLRRKQGAGIRIRGRGGQERKKPGGRACECVN